MAKKWKKKEIEDYISTKQISQENYVAPTVQTGTAPGYKSVASTVDAFNSVQPTIKSVEPTIQTTQTTVKQPKEETKGFTFSIDNKKEETPEEQRKRKIQEYNEKVAKMNGYDSVKEYDYAKAKEKYEKSSEKVKQYEKEKGYNWFKNIFTGDNENDKKYKKLIEEESKNRETFNKLKVEKNTDKVKKTLEENKNIGGTIAKLGIASAEGATRGIGGIESTARKLTGQINEDERQKYELFDPMHSKALETASKPEQLAMGIVGSWSQMAPQMLAGNPTAATAIGFANYGGSAYNDAKKGGATENQATLFGIASGGTEMLMQKLLGGFENVYGKSVLGKASNNFVNNVMTKFINNEAVRKTLTGMKGEFTEEYLQEFLEPILKNIILEEDNGADFWNTMKVDAKAGIKQLAHQLFNQQNLEAGLQGALSSGLLQGPQNFAIQNQANQYGMTMDQYMDAVQKGQLQQTSVQEDAISQIQPLEQVIRENIAQEEQQNAPQLQEQPQIPTQTPLNEVNQGVLQQNNQILGQQQTPQITPLNQVNQELQETRQQDVADSVRAMNLEQEPEFTQKQGNYVYEKSDNSKIDNLRKDAATYLKEGEQTTNFVNTLEKLVKDKDIEIRFDPNLRDSQGRMANGSYSNNVITLNPNSNRAGEFLAIHELTHAIGTKSMINMIQKYRKSNAEFDSAVKRLLTTYKATEINEEALGDIAGQLFGNQEYINNLSMENPSLFKKIYNEIKYLWHQFTGYKNQDQFIEDLRNKWESAYRNQKVQQKAKNSNIEMSTQTDSNGNMLSNEQVDYFKNSKVKDENGNLIPVYHGSPNEFTVFDKGRMKTGATLYASSGDGFYFTDNETKADKYSKGGYKYSTYLNLTNPFVVENNLSNEASNILTEFSHQIIDTHPEATQKDFGAYEVFDKNDIGQQSGTAILSGVVSEYGDEFTKFLKNKGYDGIKSSVTDYDNYGEKYNYVAFEPNQIKNIDNLTPTQDDDIRYSKEEVKKEPIKDNTGRELSKGQQEYFKNSKVRDNNGNLITVYHTMTDRGPQFNEFDARGTENYRFGDQTVNFFTNSKTMSGSYADYKYSQTDNSKFTNLEEIKNWLKEQNTLFDEYDIKPAKDGKYYITESGKGKILFDSKEQLLKNAKQKFYEYRKQFGSDKGIDNYQYEGYVNITNPYIIDGKGANWDDILTDYNKLDVEYANKISQEDKERLIEIARESQAKEKEKSQRLYEIEEEVYDGRNEKYRTIRGIKDVENFREDVIPQLKGKYKEKISNLLDEYEKLQKTPIFEDDYFRNNEEVKEILDRINNEFNMSYSNYDLYKMANNNFDEEQLKNIFGKRNSTNEIVKDVLEKNKKGSNYDGVIIKNILDYGSTTEFDDMGAAQDVYVTFNSNQFKNIDNTNPTEDPDIRYSKDNQTWREYLEKEFPSQGTRTNLQDINERNKPKQENKTIQEEKPQEMPKKEVKQEVKKSYLTSAEQNELDGLKAVENSGFAELTKEEQARMEELEKKSQGITKKFPELKKTVTQEDTKPLYFKYKDNEISRENNKILNEAKNIVESNKQGRRTKEQWLQVAEYIGSNADIKNSTDLQKLAMETWLASRPNTKDNLNRQGKKYVDFKTNEWFNAMYKGAGVGTDVKLSQEERNIINESKQDDVVVLRTPTEIQPKEVKTPEQKQEYFEESGTPKKVAKILSETPRETETSSLREMYQAAKRAVVDKGEAIYRIAKQTKNRRLYAMYDRIGLATGEGNSDIGISQTNLDGESYKNFTDSKGNKTSMSLNDIWKDVEYSNIPESVMNEYLAHYLNVDRYKPNQLSMEEQQELKELKNYKNLSKEQRETMENLEALAETRNVFGKDITREDSLNKIKEIEEKYPQIKRPAENIWQYGKNQLQKMVDAGLVSKESQEYYNENTPHYVRLQRSTESKKGSVFDSKGHLQVNNQIKKAKGGTKDIIPFKDSMAQYTLDTTSSIRKNLFGQELSKTLKNGLETDGNVDIDNIDNNILNANEDGSYTFKIFKDGKPEVLTIDKGIYEALQPNKHYELEKLFTPFRAVSNFKRTVLTDKNPLFLATNFFKDFFDAPLNTKHSTVDFVKNYGVAINQILKNGEYYQKYQALGGNQNTYFDKEGFSKPSKISKIVAPIEKANEFIEMLPRMSEFITSLKKGESLDEAMYNAAEITTNFKRGGTATKIVNRNGATFLNASVQGFDKQIRNFTEIENPKQAARLLTKTLVLGVAPALLNAVMYDDDDEYEDLPDYVKDSYYLFKTGKDNKWVRIPKGRAISVIQAAARRTYNYSKGDKDAYKGLVGHFENQLAPNNPLESNVLSPLVDVKNNKAWSGNKIVSDSIANASHPEEEYDAKTDELSKWLGKKLGKSPKKINYIIDQNTGAIGDLLLPFLTKQAEGEDDSIAGRLLKNPVKDKFTTDAVLNSKQVNQFYDAFNKAEDDKKWSKATDEDKLKYKYLYSTMLELAEKNKQIKEIESSDKSDKEKYRETKAIKQEMNDMSKKAVKESENIKINNYYAQIDDKVYKKEYDKSTGEYKYTKVQQKQLDKIKDKGVPLSDYFREAYEKQKKRATK